MSISLRKVRSPAPPNETPHSHHYLGESPWSSLNLGIKDVQHGITAAEDVGTRLKVAEVALENMVRAKAFSEAQGDRNLDSSAGYGIIRQDAGLDFENAFVKRRDADN